MKTFKSIFFIVMIIMSLSVNAQLNRFMVMTGFQGHTDTINNIPPWNRENTVAQAFFNDLKNSKYFNTIFFGTSYLPFQHDKCFYMANKADLSTIEINNYIASSTDLNYSEEVIRGFLTNTLSDTIYKNNIGFQFDDEPIPYEFWQTYSSQRYIENIARYSKLVKEANGNLLRYANLAPSLVFNTQYENREKFIQRYIDHSDPNLLSFDFYPKWLSDSSPTFFLSLYNFALKSTENSVPFIYVLTPFKNGSDHYLSGQVDNTINAKSLAEFRYLIYAALTYGAKGIAYWPGFEWVTNSSGARFFSLKFESGVLNSVSNIHKKLIDHSETLLSLNFASVYHVSNSSQIGPQGGSMIEYIQDCCSWGNIVNDKLANAICLTSNLASISYPSLAVSFLTNADGKIYFCLFNKSITNSLNFTFPGKSPITGFRDVLNNLNYNSRNPYIHLEPGEAKLFTTITSSNLSPIEYEVQKNFVSNSTTNNNDDLYALEIGDKITIKNSNFYAHATKSFMAHEIIIDPGVVINEGSNVRLYSYKNSNSTNPSLRSMTAKGRDIDNPERVDNSFSVSVYPNPVHDQLWIDTNQPLNEEVRIKIFNGRGQLVKIQKTTANKTGVYMSEQNPGLYLVVITHEGYKPQKFKVIKD